jgi:opacity protein-like surface antigen
MKKVILATLALVPALAFATPGAYVLAQAGGNYVDSGSNNNNNNSNDALYGFGGGVGAGYLWGDNAVNYGLEVDGTTYPNSTSSSSFPGGSVDTKINGYNISLLAVLKYTDCSSGFVAFAKAGAAYVSQKATVTLNVNGVGSVSGSSDTETRFAPEGDVGIGYQFNPNWEMDLTANYVYTNNNTVQNNGNLLLGVTYHFA